MKKLFLIVLAAAAGLVAQAQAPAAVEPEKKPIEGIANHLGFGIGVGLNGISIDASTPLSRWVQVRAGVSIIPSIKFKSDVDYTYSTPDNIDHEGTVELEGDLKRVQGQVLFDIFPFTHGAFRVTAGAYFGGSTVIGISGQSGELAQLGSNAGVVIGDYKIPVNPQTGEISGGIKVNNFRPYIGIGFGRTMPNNRLNFTFDLGVQIHGHPSLFTDYGEIDKSILEDDNTFNKIMDKVTVYPTLTFRLGFRAF